MDGSAFTRQGEAWSEVTEVAPGTYRVRLGGPFRGAWLAHLCCRLAEQHLSIDHVHARLSGDTSWIAELHLLKLAASESDRDPLAIDYTALAEESDFRTDPVFVIDSYRVIQSRDYGGSLMLTVEAPDSLGLLGSLLTRLALLGLVPVELHIETKEGRAYDSLWLRASGDESATPSSEAREILAAMLDRNRNIAG